MGIAAEFAMAASILAQDGLSRQQPADERQLLGENLTTTTRIPGSCWVPEFGPEIDASACDGLLPGDSCNITCASGYTGSAATYSCDSTDEDGFVGSVPVCATAAPTPAPMPAPTPATHQQNDDTAGVVHAAAANMLVLMLAVANTLV